MEKLTQKKTKIVCTIGPATKEPAVLKQVIAHGMNVARVNGAFEDLAGLAEIEHLVWAVDPNIAMMLDVKGHEVCLNNFPQPVAVKPGDFVELGSSKSDPIYPVTYPTLYKELSKGTRIVMDDGNIEAVVREVTRKGKVRIEITYGNLIKPGKSISVPGVHLSNPALTEIDKTQIKFCRSRGWTFVAGSYIRDRENAEIVKAEIKGSAMRLIAKIEEQQGIDNLDEILEIADGIMVARGDMGVEIPYERIPLIQKEIIRKCNLVGKPVITATQMLASMANSPRPTRAEITDVANAIIDGTDAIMLSEETSTGKYPVEAVTAMERIACEVEPYIAPRYLESKEEDVLPVISALIRAAFDIALTMGKELAAIAVVTRTGGTALLLGRYHLPQPIYAFVSEPVHCRRLQLSRGITQFFPYVNSYIDRDAALRAIKQEIAKRKLVDKGKKVLIVGNGYGVNSQYPNVFEVVDI